MVPCSNLPATRSEHAKVRLNTAITWFIWKGATFRVPLSTLQRSKDDGGWDMIHLKAKCLALLLHRTRIQSQDPETFTAAWLEKWNITERSPNPPHRGGAPSNNRIPPEDLQGICICAPIRQNRNEPSEQATSVHHDTHNDEG